MNEHIFIAGTDTGIGKTMITGCLAKAFKKRHRSVITQKFIQTGSEKPDDIYTHLNILQTPLSDVENYLKAMCPYIFPLPASPHLAAQEQNSPIQKHRICLCHHALTKQFKHVIVEGVGGFLVPYSKEETVADIVSDLDLPIILVVGNKLGCINHALLTIQAIRARSLTLIGVIFNQIDPNENKLILKDNPHIIKTLTGVKILANIPFQNDPRKINLDSVLDLI